jgi:hypothetical protein
LKKRSLGCFLLRKRFLLAGLENPLFLLVGRLKFGNSDRFSRVRIQSYHGKGAGKEDILGLAWLAFLSRLCDFTSDLDTTSARSIGDLAAVFKVTNLSERVRYGDTVQGGGHCGNARAGVLVDDDSRQGIKIHEQRSESANSVSLELKSLMALVPYVTGRVNVCIGQPRILLERQHNAMVAVAHLLRRKVALLNSVARSMRR